jgi:transposase
MAEKGKRRRRQFTAEFKHDAVELVRTTGRPIAHIAAELGIYDSTLGNWVKQARIGAGEQEGLTSDERARLASWSGRTPACGWSVTAQTNRRLLGQRDVDQVMRYRWRSASHGRARSGSPGRASC